MDAPQHVELVCLRGASVPIVHVSIVVGPRLDQKFYPSKNEDRGLQNTPRDSTLYK